MTYDKPSVIIYSDGSCNPNPGPGGWAAVLLFPDQPPHELTGSEPQTTNNRMELQAALEALQSLTQPHQILLYTDSQYLRQGITEWLPNWQKRQWQTIDKRAVLNQDLWQLLATQQARHQITWQWLKGHAGDKWNERVDKLAASMLPKIHLPLDDDQAIHIFTAISYSGDDKYGSWGVVLRYRDNIKKISGNETNTSGNRMHLISAVKGLQAIKKSLPIHLYTTSDYLKDGATLWVQGWAKRNWQTKGGKEVSHRDIWKLLDNLSQTYHINWHVVSKRDMPAEMREAKQLCR